jgi:hypothetical protein
MTKVSEPIALIDMDGTICDFDRTMTKALEAIASPGEAANHHASLAKSAELAGCSVNQPIVGKS